MSNIKTAELETNLFEDLSNAEMETVAGGTGTLSSTTEGLVSGAGQTVGLTLQGLLNGLSAFNNSENGFLGNATAPTLGQLPV